MAFILLRFICEDLSFFDNGTLDIDFTTEKRVLSTEVSNNVVTHLFNRIYAFNSMSFVGINASGKTMTLNIISSVLKIFIDNSSLSADLPLNDYFEDELKLTTFVYDKKEALIYKISSILKKDTQSEKTSFKYETIKVKKLNNLINKKNLFEFNNDEDEVTRGDEMKYLKDEDSIFSGVLNAQIDSLPRCLDMNRTTNFNFLFTHRSLKDLIPEAIHFLDPSIEDFEAVADSKGVMDRKFIIKFKGSNNKITTDFIHLERFLSSGTIKGINFLQNIQMVFKNGGYLIVDEIENHLNKAIVINLINMFNGRLNKNGATLIFSTHYSEIIDLIDRSDSIYVANKKDKISIQRFSQVAQAFDRSDRKKSMVFLSGLLGTAPSYKGLMNYKKALGEFINGE